MSNRILASFLILILAMFAVAGPAGDLSSRIGRMPTVTGAAAQAARIKSSPFYRDEQVAESNWWNRALTSLWNLIKKPFENWGSQSNRTGLSTPLLGAWAVYLMWTVLAVLVAVLVFVAARHIRWKVSLTRKSKALLDEDEPERTLDEWLERAAMLESEGKFREAVRCLYLACLLRFDEARVARFDRGQTNWEHLERIHASPQRPTGMDFEPPTQAFDRIWYGMRTRGKDDVDQFRLWYRAITGALMAKAA